MSNTHHYRRYLDCAAGVRRSDLALQQAMGILPERSSRNNSHHSSHPAVVGSNLKQAAG